MRIKRLDLIAFGPFTDRTLIFDSKGPGLTIIFGPNEAGKSSSLRALKCLLYGIPERTPDNFLHPNDQLLLGGCLETHGGDELTFLRRKRRKTCLFDVQDNPLDVDVLAPFLRGIGQDEFETLYGIDHEALVQGGRNILAQKGEVGQALFSAGAGIASLREILNALDEEADQLFRPRASKRDINQAISEYKKLQKDVRAATLSGRDWMNVAQGLRKTEAELVKVEQKRREKDIKRRKLERLKQALPQLALRRQYLDRLQALGDTPRLPDDFNKRRKKATHDLQAARQAQTAAASRLSSLKDKKESVSFHPALLDESQWIESLSQKLGSHRKAMKDRPRLEGMRISCKSEAAALLRQVPTDLSLEQVAHLRPFLGKRKAIQTLASKYEALEQNKRQHRQQSLRLETALSKIEGSLAQMPSLPDTKDLLQAVKLARKSGEIDSRLKEKTGLYETREAQLLGELSRLGLWNGSLKKVSQLPLPLRETVLRFEEKFRSCHEKLRAAEKDRKTLADVRGRIMGDIREIEYSGEVPTETELKQVRKSRDTQWHWIKQHWLEGEDVTLESGSSADNMDLSDAYESHVKMADHLADRLRREADRVHKFAALKADQLANREAAETTHKNLEEFKAEAEIISKEWKSLWEPCGIVPLPPKEMVDWSGKFEKIRSGAMELNKLEGEINSRKKERETLRQALLKASINLENAQTFQDETLEPVLVFCETFLETLDQKRNERRKLLEKQHDLLSDLKSARQNEETAREELADWEKRWHESAALLNNTPDGPDETRPIILPEEANDILESIQSCFLKLKEADEKQKRIVGIDRDAEDFVQEVQDLVKKVGPGLKSLQPDHAIQELQSMLKQNLEQKTLLQKYTKEIEETKEDNNRAEAAIHAAALEMAELRRIAGCKDSDDLEEAERLAREHRDLRRKCSETETALLTGAEGFSISQLEKQMEMLNPDELPGKIDALNREIEQHLDPEIRRLSETLGEKKRELQQMDGSAKAAESALSAQQTLAAIRRMSEHFIRLKTASTLLKQEIERYRNENQDPILKIASHYFRRLTLGSFEALRTDEDDRGQPVLVGLRHQNRMIRVEGMSSGTRDQLYLSLRLASLQNHRETGETLPFIVDDILVNFDDERADATLETLAELASKTQVILFTHHKRIAEEAATMAHTTHLEVHHL
jgi:uncharacterized protein YhaN